jgi:phosphoserine phosphatase
MPQAPFRTLQVTGRVIGKICLGRTHAETARRLQRVLKTNGDVPPV